MLDCLHRAIFDAGAALNTFIDRDRHRLPLLQCVDTRWTNFDTRTIAVTLVIVNFDRHLLSFPYPDVHTYFLLSMRLVVNLPVAKRFHQVMAGCQSVSVLWPVPVCLAPMVARSAF